MKILETKRVISKVFELGTIESGAPNENIVQNHLDIALLNVFYI